MPSKCPINVRGPSGWSLLPPIYILPTHIGPDSLHTLEDSLTSLGGCVTYNAEEAKIFLGRVQRKSRAAFDLRVRGVWTEENVTSDEEHNLKRRRLSSQASGSSEVADPADKRPKNDVGRQGGEITKVVDDTLPRSMADKNGFVMPKIDNRLLVVKLGWLEESLRQEHLLPMEPFIVYDARPTPKPEVRKILLSSPATAQAGKRMTDNIHSQKLPLEIGNSSNDILARARLDAEVVHEKGHPVANQYRRHFNQQSVPPVYAGQPPKLKRATTSEFEEAQTVSLPQPPEWVESHMIYSCLRSTFTNPPNSRFISELGKIKESRVLTLDQVGVRAYSTSIAALLAYPYLIQYREEILRLPGCDERLASHFSRYRATSEEESQRYLPAARELDNDQNLQHLKVFFDIWGCGAETARKMYFNHGWKCIDDVVEFGWGTLTRAQQIGVKFYDEFKIPISRAEAEKVTEIIKQHARKARGIKECQWDTDADIKAITVGGYRRGKDQCGDVDIILSHPDEDVTYNLVTDVISELEQSGYITHTLTLHTTTTKCRQQALPNTAGHGGHGFDSLDKALCVWHSINSDYSPQPCQPQVKVNEDSTGRNAANEEKNPNPHRRVDIIVAPWRSIGAAVLGWSGGTTFERDIRRWCKNKKGWKFDSGGVRDRVSGRVLDLEAPRPGDDGDTWMDRERRLMEGLGIGWRPPEARCTG